MEINISFPDSLSSLWVCKSRQWHDKIPFCSQHSPGFLSRPELPLPHSVVNQLALLLWKTGKAFLRVKLVHRLWRPVCCVRSLITRIIMTQCHWSDRMYLAMNIYIYIYIYICHMKLMGDNRNNITLLTFLLTLFVVQF